MGSGVNYSGKRVVVGLTGRIASGVTAFLLKKQGMQVIGVSVVTNSNDNFPGKEFYPKCHIEDLDAIKAFCDSLNIPFYATDGKSEFFDKVLDPLINHKIVASANTTCYSCTELRIKILFEKMKKLKADYISTGHFCKVHKNLNSEEYYIHSNNDQASDQSYLLAGIEEKYLRHLILPLGELRKGEVETIAKKFNLNLSESRDKGHFCYREKESYLNLVSKNLPKSFLRDGQVQNKDTELYHGEHEGIIHHYIGETHLNFTGLNSNDDKIKVVGYDFNTGLLKVGDASHLTFKGCQLVHVKLSSGLDKTRPMQCFLKNKYSQEFIKCQVYFKNNHSTVIEFSKEFEPLIPGEVFVLFDRDSRNAKVIGQGIVAQRGDFKLIDRVEDFKSKNEVNESTLKPERFKF